MNYRLLAKAAKAAVDQRGGTEALKQDLDALQKIAKSEGSVATKAGKAAAALKAPKSAEGTGTATAPEPSPDGDTPAPGTPATATDGTPAA